MSTCFPSCSKTPNRAAEDKESVSLHPFKGNLVPAACIAACTTTPAAGIMGATCTAEWELDDGENTTGPEAEARRGRY